MTTIHATARSIVARLRLAATHDAQGYVADAILHPTDEVRALCSYLAGVAPGCLDSYDTGPLRNVLRLSLSNLISLSIHNPAPGCFASAVATSPTAQLAAGKELLRLAELAKDLDPDFRPLPVVKPGHEHISASTRRTNDDLYGSRDVETCSCGATRVVRIDKYMIAATGQYAGSSTSSSPWRHSDAELAG